MIRLDEEEIYGIETCGRLNVLLDKRMKNCTYNFDDESKWLEFYITVNKHLTTYQASIVVASLNNGFEKLLRKRWMNFMKKRKRDVYL